MEQKTGAVPGMYSGAGGAEQIDAVAQVIAQANEAIATAEDLFTRSKALLSSHSVGSDDLLELIDPAARDEGRRRYEEAMREIDDEVARERQRENTSGFHAVPSATRFKRTLI